MDYASSKGKKKKKRKIADTVAAWLVLEASAEWVTFSSATLRLSTKTNRKRTARARARSCECIVREQPWSEGTAADATPGAKARSEEEQCRRVGWKLECVLTIRGRSREYVDARPQKRIPGLTTRPVSISLSTGKRERAEAKRRVRQKER